MYVVVYVSDLHKNTQKFKNVYSKKKKTNINKNIKINTKIRTG